MHRIADAGPRTGFVISTLSTIYDRGAESCAGELAREEIAAINEGLALFLEPRRAAHRSIEFDDNFDDNNGANRTPTPVMLQLERIGLEISRFPAAPEHAPRHPKRPSPDVRVLHARTSTSW